MLSVHGVVAVATKYPIEIVQGNSGVFFNFHVVAQRPDRPAEVVIYPTSVWVPDNEVEQYQQIIKPLSVLYLAHGNWDMIPYASGKGFIAKLKLYRRNIHHMVRPVWAPTE